MSLEPKFALSSFPLPHLTDIELAQQASEQLLREFDQARSTSMAVGKRDYAPTVTNGVESNLKRRRLVTKSDQQSLVVPSEFTKPKTRRFSIEEGEVPQLNEEEGSQQWRATENKENMEEESEDEAPEEVDAGEHEDKVELAATKAAAEAAKEASLKKEKRRQHETRMREQAQGSKRVKSRPQRKPSEITQNHESDDLDPTPQAVESSTKLPALLPEELLNMEPSKTEKLTITEVKQDLAVDKRKILLDSRDKPSKDLVRGKTRIRVLSEAPATLAPKANIVGRNLREGWLLGQRGTKRAGWRPRKQVSSGFVRKLR